MIIKRERGKERWRGLLLWTLIFYNNEISCIINVNKTLQNVIEAIEILLYLKLYFNYSLISKKACRSIEQLSEVFVHKLISDCSMLTLPNVAFLQTFL